MLLSEAVGHAKRRWAGMRKGPSNVGWADHFEAAFKGQSMDDISYDALVLYVDSLPTDLTPATIYARVVAISVVFNEAKAHGWRGVKPTMPYPRVPHKLKWWLNPQQQKEANEWLRLRIVNAGPTYSATTGKVSAGPTAVEWVLVRDYLEWTVQTGLRVEESLRLTYSHCFMGPTGPCLAVPGTKTVGSSATLPISMQAWGIVQGRLLVTSTSTNSGPSVDAQLIFPMTYRRLLTLWNTMSDALGWPPSASLKALRRSFARLLVSRRCPLPMMAGLMRNHPQTAIGYLHLVGGDFTDQELRQWL